MLRTPLLVAGIFIFLANTAQAQVNERHLQCMAHVVYGESKKQPIEGQFFVAWSMIYRALANLPDLGGHDLCAVAYKKVRANNGSIRWQYDGAKVFVADDEDWSTALYVAYWALMGRGRPEVPVMFFCSVHVRGACNWHAKATDYVGLIGGHKFYLDPRFPVVEVSSER